MGIVLVQQLQTSPEQDSRQRGEDGTDNKKATNVPGLIRVGRKYAGKVTWNHIVIHSCTEELDAAIEARMGLGTLQSSVNKSVDDGISFEDGLRAAVARLRVNDQHSCFYMQFAFEFRPKGMRFATPRTPDVDQMLEHRDTLNKLLERSADVAEINKARGNMTAEVERVRSRIKANKDQVMSQLLDEATAEIRRRGLHMPTGPAPTRPAPRPVPVLAAEIKQFKVIGPNKVGVLPRPDPELKPIGYVESGASFGVSMTHITGGRKFFQLSDSRGWVPQCSRKDPTRIIIDQHDGTVELLALEDKDEKCSDSDASSDDSSSSSSSSSPSS